MSSPVSEKSVKTNIDSQSNLIRGQHTNMWVQLFRYTFVGGAAFLVDFVCLLILVEWFDIHYLFAAALAFLIGLMVNFVFSVIWVFPASQFSLPTVLVFFGLIGLLGLSLNEALLWLFVGKMQMHLAIAKILATGVVYFWNFFARRFVLFS